MHLRVITAIVLAVGPLLARNDVLPEAPHFERYEKMLRQNPFAPVTPVVANAPEQPKSNFAASLFVVGIIRIGGVSMATVENRETGHRYMLKTGVEGPDGLSLVSIEFSNLIGRSRVTIRRRSESAAITFDQAGIIEPLISQPTDTVTALRNGRPADSSSYSPRESRSGSGGKTSRESVVNPRVPPLAYPMSAPLDPPEHRRRVSTTPRASGQPGTHTDR